ncbi:Multiple stress resistance protein BhsA precursor [Buttiauxella agrestis]|uniref:Multiple stress resistance protein BhsA n=1 Tax=Buttiauxella agrestis TaxID=82977 RepID=A0A381C7B7_9ENTR|nr:YdgH/BhsA/McbA-like domain containing protein [Buttiauxella agrestis]SUW63722.1 Multiple stress resistance protein BhsA precursor [Buttiauxella agrestis]
MKTSNIIRTSLSALILATAGFANAAEEVNTTQAKELMKIGAVSSGSAYTMNDVDDQIRMKADAAGASSYRITSVGGNNLLHGTATLYR